MCAKRVLVFSARDAKACESESSVMRVMQMRATALSLLALSRQLWLDLAALVCLDVSLQKLYKHRNRTITTHHLLYSLQILEVH